MSTPGAPPEDMKMKAEEFSPGVTDDQLRGLPAGTKIRFTDKTNERPFILPGETDADRKLKAPKPVLERAMQRHMAMQAAHARSHEQDAALDRLSADLGYSPLQPLQYEDLWEKLKTDDDVRRNPLAQKVASIEIQKRHGVPIEERDAADVFWQVEDIENRKLSAITPKAMEGQGSFQIKGTYKDEAGNMQTVSVDRLTGEQGVQRRQRKALGTSKFGKAESVLHSMDLDDDLMRAFMDPRLDAVNLPLYRTSDGTHAFDVHAARTKLGNLYFQQLLNQAGAYDQTIPEEKRSELYEIAQEKAKGKVSTIMQKNLGVYFVDKDPEQKTEDIRNNPWYLGDVPLVGGALATIMGPIRAVVAGASPMDASFNNVRTTIEDQGILDYIGSLSLGTAVGAAIHARGWNTPEHIELIRRGYDITDDFGNIAKLFTPKFLEREAVAERNKMMRQMGGPEFPLPDATFEVLAGLGPMLGLILIDPDPTLLLGPIGKGGKAIAKGLKLGSGALQVSRLTTAQKMLRKLTDMSPEEIQKGGFKAWMDEVQVLDRDLYEVFNERLRAIEGLKAASGEANIVKEFAAKRERIQEDLADLARRKKALEGRKKTLATKRDAAEILRMESDLQENALKLKAEEAEALMWAARSGAYRPDILDPGMAPADIVKILKPEAAKFDSLKKEMDALQAERKKVQDAQSALVTKALMTGVRGRPAAGKYALGQKAPPGVVQPGMARYQEKVRALEGVDKFFSKMSTAEQEAFLSRKDLFRSANNRKDLPDEFLNSLRTVFPDVTSAKMYLANRRRLVEIHNRLHTSIRGASLDASVAKALGAKTFIRNYDDYVKAKSDLAISMKKSGASVDEIKAMDAAIRRNADEIAENAASATAKAADDTDLLLGTRVLALAKEFDKSIDLIKPRLLERSVQLGKMPLFSKSLKKTPKGVMLQSEFLKKSLDERYGEDVVAKFFEEGRAGGTVTTQAFEELVTGAPRVVNANEKEIIEKGLMELEQRHDTLLPAGEELGRAVLNQMRSVYRTGVSNRKLFRQQFSKDYPFRSFVYDLKDSLRNALGGFEVDKYLRGVKSGAQASGYSGRIMDAYKTALEFNGSLNQDLGLLTRGLRGKALWVALSDYLGGTKAMKVKGGNFAQTFMNTGPVSLFEQAIRQAVSNQASIKIMDDMAEEGAEALAEDIDLDKVNKTLLALSRIWVPNAVKAGPHSGALVHAALGNIRKLLQKETISPDDVGEFVNAMKGATSGILQRFPQKLKKGEELAEGQRLASGARLANNDDAWSFMKDAVVNGVVMDEAGRVAVNTFGRMSDEMVDDMNALMRGEFDKVGGERAAAALNKMVELGLATTTREIKSDIGEFTTQLVKISQTGDGMAGFVPERLMRDLEELSGRIVKNLEIQTNKEKSGLAMRAGSFLKTLFGLFRASITAGLIFPNPRYWVNNVVGDFSQTMKEEGITTAGRLAFQNLPANLPFIGRPMQDAMWRASESVSGVPVLGPAMNSIFNPSLNRVWNGDAADVIKLNDGRTYTVGQLRRMMAEDGVMDTFVQETLLEGLRKEHGEMWELLPNSKFMGTKPGKTIKGINEAINKHATFVQQRQRAALYMEMLNKGNTRGDAKKAMLNALYDWKKPLGRSETHFLAQIFTFWRFQRLASEQLFRNMLLSAREGMPGRRVMGMPLPSRGKGARALGRIREMEQMLDTIPAAAYHMEGAGEEGQATTYAEAKDAMFRDIPFWWQAARAQAYSMPIMDRRVKEWYEKRGYDFTYQDVLVPPFTPLDMANQWLGAGYWAYGMGMGATGVTGQELTNDATSELIIDPLTAAMTPGLSTAAEQALKSFSGGTQYVGGGRTYLRPHEEDALSQSLLFGGVRRDENGRPYVDGEGRSMVILLRAMPFIGTQLPQYYAAVDNPNWVKGMGPGLAYMMAKLMGIAPRPKSPERELKYPVKERKADLQGAIRSAKARLAQEDFENRQK